MTFSMHEGDTAMFAAAEEKAPAQGRFFFCPGDWVRYKSSCFLYVNTNYSWDIAEDHCAYLGAALASAHDMFDYSFLQSLALEAGGSTAWVGGFYFERWRWVDHSRFVEFNWDSYNPLYDNKCMYLQSTVGWANGSCDTKRPYICMRRTDTC
ncbi:ladderlectin-like [Cheilinus undulatus]|uniref:ladderlectin-like n=1 Tax=Cheilinus undulatus TaxID=241271 RepID=UPI001BD1D5EC|nr:ladderlectin-like [Cheilinus undulatus]